MMIPLIYFLGTLHVSAVFIALIAGSFVLFGWYIALRALPFFSEPDPSHDRY